MFSVPNMKCRMIWILLSFGIAPAICGSKECETTEIIKCLPAFGHSGGERDHFPDTAHKLKEYCKQLMTGLNCAKRLIDSCTSVEEQQLYHNLTHEMVGMNVALCTQGSPLNIKFLKHVNCFRDLSEKFKGCSDRYIGNIVAVHGLTPEEQVKMTCCTVHEYSRCMRNVVEGRCDKEAEELVQETVLKTLLSSFKYCDQMGDIPTSNCMKMFSESQGHATGSLDKNGASNIHATQATTLLALLVSVLVALTRR